MARSLRTALNESNPNRLPSAGQVAKLGDALALSSAFVAGAVSSDALALPSNAKALSVLGAFATAGGATGWLLPVAPGAAPIAGECGVSPSGDILFAAADAVTAAEVTYLVAEGEVFTETLEVVASAAALPQSKQAVVLISAEITSGLSLGAKTSIARASAPAAGEAAISLDGASIAFAAADVLAGQAIVTYVAQPGAGSTLPSLAARLASGVDF